MRAGKFAVIIMALLLAVFVVLSFVMTYVPEIKSGSGASKESEKSSQTVTRSETREGNIRTSFFVDEQGALVEQNGGYYGVIDEFDENERVAKVTYIDKEGNPVMISYGYATIDRYYDEEGVLTKYMFLDLEGNIVKNSSGYYGMSRVYNDEGKVELEFFLDAEGNKLKLPERGYGYRYTGSTYVSIDENGKELVTFSRIMKKLPWLVFVIGIVICIIGCLVNTKLRWLLLIAYTGFILIQTLAFRGSNHGHLKLAIFDSYKDFFSIYTTRMEIINNFWLFLPFGALLYLIFRRKRVVFIATALSVIIEISQYLFDIGYCETDDVISNTLGAILGILLVKVASTFFEKMHFAIGFAYNENE